jgi:cytochrome c-type biogenesis protein CcmH
MAMTHRDHDRLDTRRGFLARAAGFAVLAAGGAPRARGMAGSAAMSGMAGMDMQQRGAVHDSSIVRDTTNLFVMDQNAARSVVRPAKRDAVPLLSDAQRDDLEHRIRCQCGCTLDVYTCRTTDFSCQVSPVMHRDVMALVQGGYSAQEILDAFTQTYGERVLMSPGKSGFNLLAWITPGFAVVVGAVVVAILIRRWGSARATPPTRVPGVAGLLGVQGAASVDDVGATPDELARLDAAVKGDDA